jgi:hypothetical protein
MDTLAREDDVAAGIDCWNCSMTLAGLCRGSRKEQHKGEQGDANHGQASCAVWDNLKIKVSLKAA